MKEERDFLGMLFEQVSRKIGRPYKQLAPFEEEMKKNWYDTPEAVKDITDAQFDKMGIPLRVVSIIRQEIDKALGISPQITTPPLEQKNPIITVNTEKQGQAVEPPKLTERTMMEAVRKLQDGLLVNYPYICEEMVKIFQTLQKIIKNIIEDPYELKFRLLKKSNSKIREIIISKPPVLKFMKDIGFEEDEETICMDKFEIHELYFVQECIDAVIVNHRSQLQQASKPLNNSRVEKREDFFLPPNIQFPKSSSESNKLEQANYAQVLDELMTYRSIMMSQVPANRNIRIYHKRHEVRNVNVATIDVERQLEHDGKPDAQIAKHIKEMLMKSKKNSAFQSRRKTEFEYLVKQEVYKQTVVKVRLPNQLIIQARFAPMETLGDVFALVANIVVGEIYMFQTPPVKRLDKEMGKTLMALDSVPSGSFYVGINSQWYIKNQFAAIVIK